VRRALRWSALLAIAAGTAVGGCRGLLGIDPLPELEGGSDAGASEASPADGDSDAQFMETTGSAAGWTMQVSGTTTTLLGVWGVMTGSTEDIYAVGDNGTILHSTGDGTWIAQDAGASTGAPLTGVWGSDAAHVFVTSTNGLLASSSAGGTWSFLAGAPTDLNCIWGTSDLDFYVGGRQGLFHVLASQVILENAPGLRPLGIFGFGVSDVYAVGTSGTEPFIVQSTGDGGWSSELHVTPSAPSPELLGIWGSGPNDLYAVGHAPYIVYSTGDGTWTGEVHAGIDAPMDAVWGSSSSNIYAVTTASILHSGGVGSAWTYENVGTSAWLGIWGSGPDDIYVVGSGGAIVHHP